MALEPRWRPAAANTWARRLGCSEAAAELLIEAPFIDLHVDMDVPVRNFRYRPGVRHTEPTRVRPLVGHTDFVCSTKTPVR